MGHRDQEHREEKAATVAVGASSLSSIGILERFTGFGICYATKDLPRTEKTACRRSAMRGIVADEFELGVLSAMERAMLALAVVATGVLVAESFWPLSKHRTA